jgi:hypothetical protein
MGGMKGGKINKVETNPVVVVTDPPNETELM